MRNTTKKPVYDFREKYEQQENYFSNFIKCLSEFRYITNINKSSMNEERKSIDLYFLYRGKWVTMEVKTDFKAAETGNLAYEIISQAYIRKNGVIGWGFKLEATDYLAYLVPKETTEIYIFQTEKIQEWVIGNYYMLRNFSAKNRDYTTLGVLIPITKIENINDTVNFFREGSDL